MRKYYITEVTFPRPYSWHIAGQDLNTNCLLQSRCFTPVYYAAPNWHRQV